MDIIKPDLDSEVKSLPFFNKLVEVLGSEQDAIFQLKIAKQCNRSFGVRETRHRGNIDSYLVWGKTPQGWGYWKDLHEKVGFF